MQADSCSRWTKDCLGRSRTPWWSRIAWSRGSSTFSRGVPRRSSLVPCVESECCYVPFWSYAEETAVLTNELRWAFVTDFESGPRSIQVLVQHQALCLIQPYPFLVLQRTHSGQIAKILMTRWRPHLDASGEFFDTTRQGIVQFEPVNCLRNPFTQRPSARVVQFPYGGSNAPIVGEVVLNGCFLLLLRELGHDVAGSLELLLDGIASKASASCDLAEGELVTQLHAPNLANHVHGDHLESPAESFSRSVEHPGQFCIGTPS